MIMQVIIIIIRHLLYKRRFHCVSEKREKTILVHTSLSIVFYNVYSYLPDHAK